MGNSREAEQMEIKVKGKKADRNKSRDLERVLTNLAMQRGLHPTMKGLRRV